MTDIKTPAQRSKNMSAIKSKNTKPEIYLCKQLFAMGYRYRKNVSAVAGHPDIWMRKYNTAIFVNGCFWHRHTGCKYAYEPKSREDFWQKKFSDNIKRDQRVKNELKASGVKCIVIWECTIKKMQKSVEAKELVLEMIRAFLCSDTEYLEI